MGSLFDAMTEIDALREGFARVEENQGCAGVDGETIEVFAAALDRRIAVLQTELRSKAYRPLALLVVDVPKANGGTRRLSIPAVRDRVVQSSAAAMLTPILDPHMEDVSFAYRKGRSVDQALQRVMELRDRGYRWVLDADIHRFFDEIPHDAMLSTLGRYVDDELLLDLVRLWLYGDVRDGDRTYRLAKGVPQGSPVSPLLANLYLDYLDERFLERRFQIVRFADDYIVLCRDQAEAEHALDLSAEVLNELGLELSPDKTAITDFDRGFDYLGAHFLRSMAYRPMYPKETDPDALPLDPDTPVEAVSVGPEPDGRTAVSAAMRRALRSIPPGASAQRWTKLHLGPPAKPSPPEEDDDPDDFAPPTAGHEPTLRTLYLMEQGTTLSKEDERFVIKKIGGASVRVPAFKVDQILVFGNVHVTTPAIQFCLLEDIPIFLLSSRGRYYGVVESSSSDRASLHAAQFRAAEDPGACLRIARGFVRGKLKNCRTLLLQRNRRLSSPSIREAIEAIGKLEEQQVDKASSLATLRGVEGAGAARYFAVWRELVPLEWGFQGRRRQPPPDPVNSLLSYGYTLLFYNAYSLVRAAGLHPYAGLYHSPRDNHPALVSDLVEEFRAPVVDSTVLSLITRGALKAQEFDKPSTPRGPCLLNDRARHKFTQAMEAKFNRGIDHPDGGEGTDYRRALFLQAQRLARAVTGSAESYEPFTTR
jgi:CRISPR-associated protein Cas1